MSTHLLWLLLESSWVNKYTNVEVGDGCYHCHHLSKLVSHLPFPFMASLPVAFWSSEHLLGYGSFLFSLGVCVVQNVSAAVEIKENFRA